MPSVKTRAYQGVRGSRAARESASTSRLSARARSFQRCTWRLLPGNLLHLFLKIVFRAANVDHRGIERVMASILMVVWDLRGHASCVSLAHHVLSFKLDDIREASISLPTLAPTRQLPPP